MGTSGLSAGRARTRGAPAGDVARCVLDRAGRCFAGAGSRFGTSHEAGWGEVRSQRVDKVELAHTRCGGRFRGGALRGRSPRTREGRIGPTAQRRGESEEERGERTPAGCAVRGESGEERGEGNICRWRSQRGEGEERGRWSSCRGAIFVIGGGGSRLGVLVMSGELGVSQCKERWGDDRDLEAALGAVGWFGLVLGLVLGGGCVPVSPLGTLWWGRGGS